MKTTLATLIAFLAVASLPQITSAQNTDATKVNTVQPKIMVIPFAKEGEDMRTILDKDFNKREGVARVKNGFDNHGFTTKDFVATLKQALDDRLFTTGTQSDVKSSIISLSGADIYVEVDINETTGPDGNTAKVLLSAYDAATASAYASITCDSRLSNISDYGMLVTRALTATAPGTNQNESVNVHSSFASTPAPLPCLDDFLGILQAKFTEIMAKGRPIKFDFTAAADAANNFDSKKPGNDQQLSDIIDDYMGKIAYKNNYHLQGTSPSRLFYDDVRISVYDDNGNNKSLSRVGQDLAKFLKTKGYNCSRSIKNGGIYITITD